MNYQKQSKLLRYNKNTLMIFVVLYFLIIINIKIKKLLGLEMIHDNIHINYKRCLPVKN